MSDAALRTTSMTLAEFDSFLSNRPEHEHWELIGGAAEMMTNPLLNHGLIVGNIFAPLKTHLSGGDCRAFAGGLRVQRSNDAGESFAAIPDIVVQCGPRPNRAYTLNAVAVVEVLSRSTMHRDRGAKFDFYRSLPTLHHIVFAYQSQMRVEHYRRTNRGWVLSESTRSTDRLTLDAIGFDIDLGTVYDDVSTLRSVAVVDDADDEAPPIP